MQASPEAAAAVASAPDASKLTLDSSALLLSVGRNTGQRILQPGSMGMKGAQQDAKDAVLPKYRLKIQPQPPKFPFAGQYFDMSVYLVDERDRLKVGSKVPLLIKPVYEDHSVVDDPSLLHVNPETQPIIEATGMATLQVRITKPSMGHGNKAFRLHVSATGPEASSIEPAVSSAMIVIRHRLVISQQPPDVWYKDEGGRDKCIAVIATLVDENNQPVRTREVPLRVTLLYDNGTIVRKQSILKMSPDTKAVIGNDGQATLKLRIEEVSKNHQNQGFSIKVEPDTSASPLNHDISFDISSAITVRSKRNKKRKASALDGSDDLGILSHIATSTGTAGAVSTHGSGFREPFGVVQSQSAQNESTEQALKGVFHWSVEVVETLRAIEWQVIGYEFKADGMADPNRPIYRCPGCWSYRDSLARTGQHSPACSIAALLSKYDKQTLLHLRTLYAQLDEGDDGEDHDADDMKMSDMPMKTATHPGRPSDMFSGPAYASQTVPAHMLSIESPNKTMVEHVTGGTVQTAPVELSAPVQVLAPMPSLPVATLAQVGGGVGGGGPVDSLSGGPSGVSEERVTYIFAKDTQFGFAAFDNQRNPVGFYRLMEEPLGLHLLPIQMFSHSMKEVERIKSMFEEEMLRKSPAVKSLHECLSLDRLKEEALLCYWSQGIMADAPVPDTVHISNVQESLVS